MSKEKYDKFKVMDQLKAKGVQFYSLTGENEGKVGMYTDCADLGIKSLGKVDFLRAKGVVQMGSIQTYLAEGARLLK